MKTARIVLVALMALTGTTASKHLLADVRAMRLVPRLVLVTFYRDEHGRPRVHEQELA